MSYCAEFYKFNHYQTDMLGYLISYPTEIVNLKLFKMKKIIGNFLFLQMRDQLTNYLLQKQLPLDNHNVHFPNVLHGL